MTNPHEQPSPRPMNEHGNTQELGYGWLYVVTHPNARGMVKVGVTDRPTARISELGDAEILARVPVKHPRKHEQRLHRHFVEQRLPQSEWFNLRPDQRDELLGEVRRLGQQFLELVVIPMTKAEQRQEIEELARKRDQEERRLNDASPSKRLRRKLGLEDLSNEEAYRMNGGNDPHLREAARALDSLRRKPHGGPMDNWREEMLRDHGLL